MTRTELVRSMSAYTKCPFITRKQLQTYLGYKDRQSVAKYLKDLMPVASTRYYIQEVAERILEQ